MPGPDFWKGPVHSGKNLRGETRFGFSKNPTGEFLKSRAMKEGVDFARTPLLPHQEIQYETIFLFRIYDFLVKAVWIEINNFINCILDGPILVLVA